MDYTLARLDNGLQVVAAPMPWMYSVTASVIVGVGSRHERPPEAGSAHLIEHMLFKGTQRRPSAEAISETIERVGGMLNASTDKELTVYWTKVSSTQAELAGDLLADMLLHSTMDASEVEKERRVVLEELSMSMDTPQDWVHTLIDQACWPNTALGRDVAGTRESVAGLERAGLLGFMAATYLPGRTVVSIAGAIDAQEAIVLADRMFGGWRDGQELSGHSQLRDAPVAYPHAQPEIRYEQRDTEQVNLCVATRGVSRISDDRYAFELLAAILGGGMSSRLFLEVRERRALAYDIHTYTNKLADTGSLVTYAAVEPGHCREVVAEIVSQLHRLCTDPVPDSELGKVKDYYKGRLLLGLEDTQSVAGWCGVQQQLQGSIQQPEEVCSAVDRVSAGDLQRLAADCFQSDFLRLVALGPLSGAEGLEDALCLR